MKTKVKVLETNNVFTQFDTFSTWKVDEIVLLINKISYYENGDIILDCNSTETLPKSATVRLVTNCPPENHNWFRHLERHTDGAEVEIDNTPWFKYEITKDYENI